MDTGRDEDRLLDGTRAGSIVYLYDYYCYGRVLSIEDKDNRSREYPGNGNVLVEPLAHPASVTSTSPRWVYGGSVELLDVDFLRAKSQRIENELALFHDAVQVAARLGQIG
jgi:hypothetical protein